MKAVVILPVGLMALALVAFTVGPQGGEWRQIAFSGQEVHQVTVASWGEIYVSLGADLQRSDDSGHSWQSIGAGLPERPAGADPWQIIPGPARPEELYAYAPGQSPFINLGCSATLARSDDGGASWVQLHPPNLPWRYAPPETLPPNALSIHPHPLSGELYVWEFLAADPRSGGLEALLRSSDGGQTWTELPLPPKPPRATWANRRFFGFHRYGDDAILYGQVKDVAYTSVATNPIYLHRSLDGGLTWEEIPLPEESPFARYAPIPDSEELYVALASCEGWQEGNVSLYRLGPGGAERQGRLPLTTGAFPYFDLALDPADGDRLACAELPQYPHSPPVESVSVREDGGANWLTLSLPHPLNVHDVAFGRSTLYLATDDGFWVYD